MRKTLTGILQHGETKMKLFHLAMDIYARYILDHVCFFKLILGSFSKSTLRVNESFPSNRSPLSATFKGLSQESAHSLYLLTMTRSYKNSRKGLLVSKTTRIYFCFLVVLENILITKIIKLHVRLILP